MLAEAEVRKALDNQPASMEAARRQARLDAVAVPDQRQLLNAAGAIAAARAEAAGSINKGAVVAPGEPVAGDRLVQLPESVVRDAASLMQQLAEFVEELMAVRR